MDHRERAYKQFKAEFERGLSGIAEIEKTRMSPQERHRAVDGAYSEAIDRLGETTYGRKLVDDADLTRISLNLEDGLIKIANELGGEPFSESLDVAILWANKCRYERRFKFLGEMGRIFNYFRDLPRFLDAEQERIRRESLREAAMECIEQADALLFHVTAALMYEGDVVSAIRQLSHDAGQLRHKLARPPVDLRQGASPFHHGETIIVRQFSQAVSLLGFGLYGWMNSRVLTSLLEMKASTAKEYGLPLYLLDANGSTVDRERKLRGFISEALKDARQEAKRPEYRTREMVEFYRRNRRRFTQDDGLPDPSLEVY